MRGSWLLALHFGPSHVGDDLTAPQTVPGLCLFFALYMCQRFALQAIQLGE